MTTENQGYSLAVTQRSTRESHEKSLAETDGAVRAGRCRRRGE